MYNLVSFIIVWGNMPGAVPRTSTLALNNATLPFVLAIANHGKKAMINDKNLLNGLNIHNGKLTCNAVAGAFNLEYTPAFEALGN